MSFFIRQTEFNQKQLNDKIDRKIQALVNGTSTVANTFNNSILADTYADKDIVSVAALERTSGGRGVAGGSGADTIVDAAKDSADNIYIGLTVDGSATARDFNAGVLATYGGTDVVVVKLNRGGEQQWARAMGSTAADSLVAVRATDDYVYVMGLVDTSASPKDFEGAAIAGGGSSGASADVFVAQLDAATGAQNWIKVCGSTSGNDAATLAAPDAAGNVFVAGLIDAAATPKDFDGGAVTGVGLVDIFLARLEADGTQTFFAVAGTALDADAAPLQLAVDAAGAAHLAGTVNGANTITDFAGGNPAGVAGGDLFVAKVSSAGAQQWFAVAGNSGGQTPSANTRLFVDASSNVLLATTVASSGTITDFAGGNPAGLGSGSTVLVAKLNSAGAQQFFKLGGAVSGAGDALFNAYLVGGFVYAAGTMDGTASIDDFNGATVGTKTSATDNFVLKLSASTGTQAFLVFAGSVAESDLAVDSAGNVYVASATDHAGTALDFDANALTPTVSGATKNCSAAKLDSAGAQQWFKLYGADDAAVRVALETDGAVHVSSKVSNTAVERVVGASGASLKTGGGSGNDALLTTFDADGGVLFEGTIGGDADDDYHAAIVTNGGRSVFWVGKINFSNPVTDFFNEEIRASLGVTSVAFQIVLPRKIPVGVSSGSSGASTTAATTTGIVQFPGITRGKIYYFDHHLGVQLAKSDYIIGSGADTNRLLVHVEKVK